MTAPSSTRSAVVLRAAADRVVSRVGHWTEAQWARAGRAELMVGLIQQLADAAADVEGRPRRAVPRPPTDLVLPDQFRVMINDLLAANPPADVLDATRAAIEATAAAL